ncbi:N-acetylmuramoyl-L-alanine amidase [Bacillus sp. 165]|uniref:N-acetylmuramoyl-L-alanine amidase n=1 Tax=Bacillus sp. 165 TaxID=1529117 RepID=UPI001AD9F250|nr:N-acetylmuramoyl-L-alanine amidase [Bacillus sp. 165]MBO9128908.1 N-acetylmuramoyl-L-alanine amidase [Bacillus sp. 165]
MVKIWVDAGHGGKDPGASGYGLQEKSIVLELAHQVRRVLITEYTNIQIGMTRVDDTFVGLTERTRRANAWGADVFVSLHCNSGGGRGFESYCHTNASSNTVALQAALHSRLIAYFSGRGGIDRGMKAANFAVLRLTSMPAVLTESLFMDNEDIIKFKDMDFLIGTARAHAEGIAQYFNLTKVDAPFSYVQWNNEAAVPYPGRLIRKGSKGRDVERIQRTISVTPDGIFGLKTELAVRAYQARHGLVADGIVGPKTWNEML